VVSPRGFEPRIFCMSSRRFSR